MKNCQLPYHKVSLDNHLHKCIVWCHLDSLGHRLLCCHKVNYHSHSDSVRIYKVS